MKLRNKKTGVIWNIPKMRHPTIQEDDISFFAHNRDEGCLFSYKSIAELNDEWEDYILTEPMIKDDKIRTAVRAWAEANKYDKLWVYHDHTAISFYNEDDGDNEITFNTLEKFGLEHLKCYTIYELCGDEE